MDLGLDYCRVLLALGFVSSRFCTPKSAWPVGVIGVSRQAFSGFYDRLWVTGYAISSCRSNYRTWRHRAAWCTFAQHLPHQYECVSRYWLYTSACESICQQPYTNAQHRNVRAIRRASMRPLSQWQGGVVLGHDYPRGMAWLAGLA